MGDAGPPTPILGASATVTAADDEVEQREVTVLVTGFGPFKSFHLNPSHLIAIKLPPTLDTPVNSSASSASSSSTTTTTQTRIRIRILAHPTPLRVSYRTVAATIPLLVASQQPDYVVHIGMAGGRDYYTLETRAQRDGYRIKDVDGLDGLLEGEARCRGPGGVVPPEVLEAGWNGIDVEGRWKAGLGTGERDKVRLSSDAGRFLCDFVFYESLLVRWKEGRMVGGGGVGSREGKVAFLHVPGETDGESIARGSRVAEAAILALVASWEEGFRREKKGVREEKFGIHFFG